MAKRLQADNTLEISKYILDLINNEINEKYTSYAPDPAIAYKIFKPLNERKVSKSITAQCLAELLNSDKDLVKDLILKDEKLKYLRDAIYYVTALQTPVGVSNGEPA